MSYSDVRIYMRPIARDAERADVEDLFKGYGKLVEVKLMSGFGFVEFENARDAQDVVAEFNGKNFMGERLQIEFAKVQRRRDDYRRDEYRRDGGRDSRDGGRDDYRRRDGGRDRNDRIDRRPRRSGFRIKVSGLPSDCSWQDLKDFGRRANVDIVYADVSRDRDGTGVIEVEREDDLGIAMDKLVNEDVKGTPVTLKEEIVDMPRERSRSPYRRSPPRRSYGRYGGGDDDGYRRRDRSRSPRRDRDRRDRGGYDRRDRHDRRDRNDREDDVPPPPPVDTSAAGDWDRTEDGPKPASADDFDSAGVDQNANDTW
ncbi:hypothetical protein V1512DRAFT_259901 [Lipomyces arxii]|uniref:uncharacterized protein n=1 Tax=Lipomyces arxii TaxID=56418 RepID=UPI0034CEE260